MGPWKLLVDFKKTILPGCDTNIYNLFALQVIQKPAERYRSVHVRPTFFNVLVLRQSLTNS